MKRVVLFLAVNFAILLVLGISLELLGIERILDANGVGLDYTALLALSAVVGMGGAFLSLAISKPMARWTTGARIIDTPTNDVEAWLVQRVTQHAKACGIGVPDVAVYDSPEPNAFATGARRNSALVAVSTGLMRGMSREEADAVLAHEVSHVANGDMVTLTLISGVVNTFVVFLSRVIGYLVDRVVFKTEEGHGPAFWITTIVAQIFIGIGASAVVMWFSRQREFRADAGAASLVGASAMISALERLKAAAEVPGELPDSVAAFGIRAGASRFGRAFASHPPLEERIQALRRA